MNENKTVRIELLATPEQLSKLKERAAKHGAKIGPYLLMCGLNARIEMRVGSDPTSAHMRDAVSMVDRGLITKEEFTVLKKRIFEDSAELGFKSLERRIKKDKERQ